MEQESLSKRHKLGVVSGVYIPVCLNILSILMFLWFGLNLGQIGVVGIFGVPPPFPPPPPRIVGSG
jgi:potassium/chloride transporter 9